MIRDLKNAAVAMESYFADKKIYTAAVADILAAGFRQTPGVNLSITIISPNSYTMTAAKPQGAKPSYSYSSTTGLIQ